LAWGTLHVIGFHLELTAADDALLEALSARASNRVR